MGKFSTNSDKSLKTAVDAIGDTKNNEKNESSLIMQLFVIQQESIKIDLEKKEKDKSEKQPDHPDASEPTRKIHKTESFDDNSYQ